MTDSAAKIETDRQRLIAAEQQGPLARLGTYARLSGPGWLQSALTLGGGSLGSSLYLGILAGTSMLWLQPYAMLLGVVMMSAISYVVLSTGERPFRAINNHINPVLGWSWLAATLMANMVWSLPQYSLCFAVCEQNFFPALFQGTGLLSPEKVGPDGGKWIVSFVILALCTAVTWSYGSGHWGVKLYELLLKIVVAVIVACFVGVVIRMSLVGEGIDWAEVLGGFIPDTRHFYQPAETFAPLLEKIIDPAARQYWSDLIVSQQRDVMLSAIAAAVGINMTFLLPYSLLSRGWDKAFRGLTIFDLATGTMIPFVLATGCIVIAAALQFHVQLPQGTEVQEDAIVVPDHLTSRFDDLLKDRDAAGAEGKYDFAGAPRAGEQQLAAMLVKRDTYDLARSLNQLFAGSDGRGGYLFSNLVFGFGVVAMTLSSISLMMLISGFVVCEVLDRPPTGWPFRIGCLISATGVLWPLYWSGDARAWLTVVAGTFGAMLLPIAYVTFWIMMNQRSMLGDQLPTGWKRWLWNVLLAIAALSSVGAGIAAVIKKAGLVWGLSVVAAFLAIVLVAQVARSPSQRSATDDMVT